MRPTNWPCCPRVCRVLRWKWAAPVAGGNMAARPWWGSTPLVSRPRRPCCLSTSALPRPTWPTRWNRFYASNWFDFLTLGESYDDQDWYQWLWPHWAQCVALGFAEFPRHRSGGDQRLAGTQLPSLHAAIRQRAWSFQR